MQRIFCHVPIKHAETIATFLEDKGCLAVSWMEDEPLWVVDGVIEDTPSLSTWQENLNVLTQGLGISAIMLQSEDIPEKDWLQETYRLFPPFSVGRFFIHGSHEKNVIIPKDKIALEINAATAFGSGEHETTKGCLLFLQELHEQDPKTQRILDLGCGSGILAIACAKLWNITPFASDNDKEAVRVTAENALLNGVTLHNFVSDGTSVFQEQGLTFQGIVANILAGPLIFMAKDIVECLEKNSWLILSGLRTDQAKDVIKSYSDQGMSLTDKKDLEGWSTLFLKKS